MAQGVKIPKRSKKGRQNSHNKATNRYVKQRVRTERNKEAAKARRERWLEKRHEKNSE